MHGIMLGSRKLAVLPRELKATSGHSRAPATTELMAAPENEGSVSHAVRMISAPPFSGCLNVGIRLFVTAIPKLKMSRISKQM